MGSFFIYGGLDVDETVLRAAGKLRGLSLLVNDDVVLGGEHIAVDTSLGVARHYRRTLMERLLESAVFIGLVIDCFEINFEGSCSRLDDLCRYVLFRDRLKRLVSSEVGYHLVRRLKRCSVFVIW